MHLLNEYLLEQNDKTPILYVEKASAQIAKLTKLIDELLDLSRIEANKMEYHYSVFSYEEFLSEVISNHSEFNNTHAIEVTGDGGIFIRADRELLTQAVVNLIDNAIKFSPASNKIIINMSVSKNQLKTTVTDFGIGIDKKHHKKIFDRFYRVSEMPKQTYPGLGIGLYLTAQIIKKHSGKIWVESEQQKETNFVFTVPVYSEK
jgi:signal transduction histidine kinase